ncbi:MAG: Hsp20/alpha crystallin family protein [Thermodesulfobacteriota bacterium]
MLLRMYDRPLGFGALSELERMRNEFNRLFEGFERRTPAGYPAMNLWASTDDAVLTAEIPGVDPKTISISVTGETLTLKGDRKTDVDEGKFSWHRRERPTGEFTRTISLPFRADAGKVEAKCSNGVLHIRLPRAEEEKPRKIEIHS